MYSLNSSKFTRIAVRIFIWIFAGLMVYSSCMVFSQGIYLPDEVTFGGILYLIGCLFIIVFLIVGPILKKVKNKNSYSTLTVPFSITVFSLLLSFDNFLAQINEFNIIFGACLLVSFAMAFLSIILFKIGEKKAQFSQEGKILSLGKGLLMGAIIILFVFSILLIAFGKDLEPLSVAAYVVLLIVGIGSFVDTLTYSYDDYDGKISLKAIKNQTQTPNKTRRPNYSSSSLKSQNINKKHDITFEQLELAKKRFDNGEISEQEFESIKAAYLSTINKNV